MFELTWIRQFLTIAECGTLLKAAERLHMTQPGLSKSMRNLERELGVPLFDRRKNRVELNETGRRAVELLSGWYAQADQLQSELREFDRRHRHITAGACGPLPMSRSIRSLLAMKYPGIPCTDEIQPPEVLERGLRDGTYQFVVLPYAPEGNDTACAFYGEEQLYVTLPENHPLAARRNGIRFSDLDGQTVLSLPQTGYWFDLPKRMLPHSHIIDHSELYDFEEVMEGSSFPTFITTYLMEVFTYPASRVAVPLLDPEARVSYWCVCLKENSGFLSPLFNSFPSGRL